MPNPHKETPEDHRDLCWVSCLLIGGKEALFLSTHNVSMAALMIFLTLHRTTEGLEMSLKGKYLVTVTATDTGGLSSSTVLDVSD